MDRQGQSWDTGTKLMMSSAALFCALALLNFITILFSPGKGVRVHHGIPWFLGAAGTVVILLIACIEPSLILKRLGSRCPAEQGNAGLSKALHHGISSIALLFSVAILLVALWL